MSRPRSILEGRKGPARAAIAAAGRAGSTRTDNIAGYTANAIATVAATDIDGSLDPG